MATSDGSALARRAAGEDPLADLTLDAQDVLLLVSALGFTLIVNNFVQKWGIPVPEAITTIALGAAFGGVASLFPSVSQGTFQKLENTTAKEFMLIFLAPIIFAEGYGLKSRQFFGNIWRILAHAFVGTFVSTVVVGFIVFYLPRVTAHSTGITLQPAVMSLAECLAFGALISATDPVTTLSIFKDLQMVENGFGYLYYSVLGESILNDAVAVTLFGSFADLVYDDAEISSKVALNIFTSFCWTFAGSMLLGLCCGIATALVLKFARLGAGASEEEHFYFNVPELGVMLVMAYVPFLAAEAANLSGIVAIMFAGVAMRHYAHYNMTQVTRTIFLPTVELLATLCETYVFVLLGIGVFLLGSSNYSLSMILWTIIACILGRFANVYPIAFAINHCSSAPRFSFKEQHVMWLAGLRGAMAFVCALGFPTTSRAQHRDLVLCTTMIVVGVTILVFGWPTATVLRCLDVAQPGNQNHGDHVDDAAIETASGAGAEQQRTAACGCSANQRMEQLGYKLDNYMMKALMTSDAMLQRIEFHNAAVSPRDSESLPQSRPSRPSRPSAPLAGFLAGSGHLSALQAAVMIPKMSGTALADTNRPSNSAVAASSPHLQVGAPAEEGTGNAARLLAGRPSAPARLVVSAATQNPTGMIPVLTQSRPSGGLLSTSSGRHSGDERPSVPRPSMPRSSRMLCDP